jgi:branched-chain amino acid transport system ATP-binding protein
MSEDDTPAGTETDGATSDGVSPVSTEPDQELVVHVDQVIAGYVPGVNILNGASMEVYDGDLIGIIGPNGAGKSTMLKALFGLLSISEGRVLYKGKDITNLKAHSLVSQGIGYVPQVQNVFTSMTIEENLQMGVYLRPRRYDERVGFVTDIFPKLADRLKQRAGLLSGGERQMLAMGRALMMDPDVLLLDEPSAGLSPVLQDQVFDRVKSINEAGVTVIMVEQNAHRCLQICDRGYVLDQGRNAYTDTGQNLLRDPKVIELYLGTLVS